jgi:hypothetical protein
LFPGGDGVSANEDLEKRAAAAVAELCDPITTVWVAGSARVVVATPPGGWEEHLIPQEVFDDPDRWIEP